jgi:hypothetical protein
MGRAGRARALERFDLTHQVAKFLRLYGELLELPIRTVHD